MFQLPPSDRAVSGPQSFTIHKGFPSTINLPGLDICVYTVTQRLDGQVHVRHRPPEPCLTYPHHLLKNKCIHCSDLSQSQVFVFPRKTNKHVIKKTRHYLGRSQSSYQSFHTVVHLFSPAFCFEFSSVKPKQNLALPLRVMFIISHECVSGSHNAISNRGSFPRPLSEARTHHMLILSLKLALPLF